MQTAFPVNRSKIGQRADIVSIYKNDREGSEMGSKIRSTLNICQHGMYAYKVI